MKAKENIQWIGKILWEEVQSLWTIGRSLSNLWIKWWLMIQAGIIDKYTNLLPQTIWETASDTADIIAENVGKVLEIHSDVPGIYDALKTIPNFEELAHDLQNIWNIWGYMAGLILVYWFSRFVLQGEKWRFEASTSALVWTVLSVGIFKEMHDVLQGYWHDIMEWLPLKFFNQFPESIREAMLDADGRKNIYAGTLWAVWTGTSLLAIKNYVKVILWSRKSKK